MKSVRARLTAINSAFLAVLMVVIGLGLHFRFQSILIAEVDRQLRSTDRVVFSSSSIGEPAVKGISRGERTVQILRRDHSEVRLDTSSTVPTLIPSPYIRGPLEPPLSDWDGYRIAQSGEFIIRTHWTGTQWLRTISEPVIRDGKVMAVVQASRELKPVYEQVAALDLALWTFTPMALLIAALGGWILVGNTMKPIRVLTASARQLGQDPSGPLLPADGNDEFANLAETFNGALERQRRAMAQLERFTGDAGHELRTPLGALKGAGSYLLHTADLPEKDRPFAELIDRSADRMSRLIDDLLVLARRDGGQRLAFQPGVRVREILEEAVDEVPKPDACRLNLSMQAELELECDPDALRRIAMNLLSNAYEHARTEVEISAVCQDEAVTISVRDDGEGIPDEYLAKLGERFYRPDLSRARTRGGTGLGLAIVKSLCEAHGGCLKIESTVGAGTCAFVNIPVRQS